MPFKKGQFSVARLGQVLQPKFKLAKISMMELREHPGEILEAASRGATFIVTKQGKPQCVLSALPGEQLSIIVKPDGTFEYELPS